MVQRPILQGFRLVTSTTSPNTNYFYSDRQPSPSTSLSFRDPTSSSPSPSPYSSSSTFVSSLADRGDVLYVTGHKDPATKKNIILWDDILIPFKGAMYIRQGATVVPFLKGHDFKNLEPLRIAVVPNVILEVVVAESQSTGDAAAFEGQVDKLADGVGKVFRETLVNHRTTTTTKANKAGEADKVAINTDPQEMAIFIVDYAEDMVVKEEPRDDEIVTTKVVTPAQKEKEKAQEKAPNNSNNAKSNDSNIGNITSNNATSNKKPEQDENAIAAEQELMAAEQELMAAERGDAEAQFRVGSMYRRGQGLPQSNAKSRKWYLRAAEQGHMNAQFKLGMILENGGPNVAMDLATAVDWYRKAANHGHPEAQIRLGVLYGKDTGVPLGDKMAPMWYTRAAEQGVELAQLPVGIQYHQGGVGVPPDCVQAQYWVSKSSEKGNADAQPLRHHQAHEKVNPRPQTQAQKRKQSASAAKPAKKRKTATTKAVSAAAAGDGKK
ncbi:hypothetical protein BGZ47_006363 [Haplosporangium gracile]|nr:hypothetical protein BGZ47_006363 [Haplosporangium gracile]